MAVAPAAPSSTLTSIERAIVAGHRTALFAGRVDSRSDSPKRCSRRASPVAHILAPPASRPVAAPPTPIAKSRQRSSLYGGGSFIMPRNTAMAATRPALKTCNDSFSLCAALSAASPHPAAAPDEQVLSLDGAEPRPASASPPSFCQILMMPSVRLPASAD